MMVPWLHSNVDIYLMPQKLYIKILKMVNFYDAIFYQTEKYFNLQKA